MCSTLSLGYYVLPIQPVTSPTLTH